MIRLSRRERKAKVTAEVLVMIADAHLPPHHPRPVLETEEWLFESAAGFCAVLDKYCAAHTPGLIKLPK